jgi:large subunit ribosomal protein L10
MLTREQKEKQVAELRDKFERATSIFVADYSGLEVKQIEALRGGLRQAEASESEFRIAKNSVLRLACEGSPAESLKDHFRGTTSIAMSFGDPVALAKTLVEYATANEDFEIRGGCSMGRSSNSPRSRILRPYRRSMNCVARSSVCSRHRLARLRDY